MNRYYKLQNGDILDRATDTTISRDRLLEILNLDESISFLGDIDDELARDENSVLD